MIWRDTFGYKLLLFLHIASAVIGFGGYMLNGFYGRAAAKESPDGARAISAASLQVSTATQYAIYGVLIFGGALVGASDKLVKFSQAWVPVSVVLWVAIVGVLHGVILPAQRKLRDGDPDRASLTQRLSVGIGVMNLLVLVTLVLMIWEPGTKGL